MSITVVQLSTYTLSVWSGCTFDSSPDLVTPSIGESCFVSYSSLFGRFQWCPCWPDEWGRSMYRHDCAGLRCTLEWRHRGSRDLPPEWRHGRKRCSRGWILEYLASEPEPVPPRAQREVFCKWVWLTFCRSWLIVHLAIHASKLVSWKSRSNHNPFLKYAGHWNLPGFHAFTSSYPSLPPM